MWPVGHSADPRLRQKFCKGWKNITKVLFPEMNCNDYPVCQLKVSFKLITPRTYVVEQQNVIYYYTFFTK